MTNEEAREFALTRLRSGAKQASVQMELMAAGFGKDDAWDLVFAAEEIDRAESKRRASKRGNQKMLAGAFFLVIGLGSVIYTYNSGGGTVIIPFGIPGWVAVCS